MKPHWPEFILSHFIASLPGSLSIESSCANRRTTIFLKRSASPTVLRSWRIEGLAASFQSQMGSKFLHRGFANLHPNIPGLVDWIGCLAGWFTVAFCEEHLWNHQCVAIKLSRKDVWYTDPVYMRMFCHPMCN